MAIYLRAADGEYAKRVLVAGDPGRIRRLGELLEDTRLVTENRGLLGYTGRYKGEPVSVQSVGMGCPSMAMVGEELFDYGVEQMIRIGTCSAFASGVANGDVIVVTGSAASDGTTASLAGGGPVAAIPDYDLTTALVVSARARLRRFHVGPVVTVDVEPHLSATSTASWREQGLLAVEMEASAMFNLALRRRGRGHQVRAACVLTVSDGLDGHPDGAQRYLDDEALAAATDAMHVVALEALVAIPLA
ncbi:MAG: purine-nucleoside phosphorylase [Actinomycetota bacterium]|nr:purine-nucleoside phosphorylase [Actinomycetota bacterium]